MSLQGSGRFSVDRLFEKTEAERDDLRLQHAHRSAGNIVQGGNSKPVLESDHNQCR